jgi:hypothetical protein
MAASDLKRRFSNKAIEGLGYYVYLYIDPRDGTPFYIGKGKGSRCFAHLGDNGETEKADRIRSIRAEGYEPRIDILKYGLTEAEALLVESTAIDLIDVRKLTNCMRGHGSRTTPRGSVDEIAGRLDVNEIEIGHPSLLIVINKLYRHDMSVHELYDATRSAWKLGPRREKVRYAMAVYQGIVREVYEIGAWLEAGRSMRLRDADGRSPDRGSRWEFAGNVAEESIRRRYLNKSVAHYFSKGAQNPIQYAGC